MLQQTRGYLGKKYADYQRGWVHGRDPDGPRSLIQPEKGAPAYREGPIYRNTSDWRAAKSRRKAIWTAPLTWRRTAYNGEKG
jgi:hypothetical protein